MIKPSLIPLPRFLTTLFMILGIAISSFAEEGHYETRLTLESPVLSGNLDEVIFQWATEKDAGNVGMKDLTQLVVELYAEGVLVFSDVVILDGVVQDLAAEPGDELARDNGDVFWDFHLETLTMKQFRNIYPKLLKITEGDQYHVADGLTLPDDGKIHLSRYLNGTLEERAVGALLEQYTIPLADALDDSVE